MDRLKSRVVSKLTSKLVSRLVSRLINSLRRDPRSQSQLEGVGAQVSTVQMAILNTSARTLHIIGRL